MSGFFSIGEQKVRPGSYIRYENGGSIAAAGAVNGVVAAVFANSFGPLGEVISLNSEAEIKRYYGPDGVDILSAAILGGASEIKAVRAGTGGTKSTLVLKDTAATPAEVLTITAKYPGSAPMSLTIRDSIADENEREALLFSGLTQIAKYTFAKGTDEAKALKEAVNENEDSIIEASGAITGSGTLADIAQKEFTAGTDPTVNAAAYSNAFDLLESQIWNVLILDTNDNAIQTVAASYIKRVTEAGLLVFGVFSDPTSVAYASRKARAASFNDPGIVYVLNGCKVVDDVYEGYLAAAVIAGMIASTPSSQSLTHEAIPGATDIVGELTNSQIVECLKSGALVLTRSSAGAIWIEQGINTLVTLSGNQDEGWKKIRRAKTRYELMSRVESTVEQLIGKINNSADGRATFIMAAQGVINEMISEGKLIDGTITEDASNPPKGDSAWFILATNDLDSLEKAYTTFRFQFSAN